jgi:deoxyhypusine monooxygenase
MPTLSCTFFTLRNLNGVQAVDAIGDAFTDESVLLKHELAYCLGQMQHPQAIPILTAILKNEQENPIVRHEAAEALGAIGKEESLPVLNMYRKDP